MWGRIGIQHALVMKVREDWAVVIRGSRARAGRGREQVEGESRLDGENGFR